MVLMTTFFLHTNYSNYFNFIQTIVLNFLNIYLIFSKFSVREIYSWSVKITTVLELMR